MIVLVSDVSSPTNSLLELVGVFTPQKDKITGKRLKLKSQDYVEKHHQLGTLNIKRLIPLVLKGESDEIVSYFPHVRECVKDIKKRHADYLNSVELLIEEYHAKCSEMSRHEIWIFVSSEIEDTFAKSVLMKTLDEDKDVRPTLEKELKTMAITDYKKGTYKGVQTFQTTSAKYLSLMGFRDCGGPVVKEWKGYFLRDDSEIRSGAGMEPTEAYSLFQQKPYGRVKVFAGPKEWAIKESEIEIQEVEDAKVAEAFEKFNKE